MSNYIELNKKLPWNAGILYSNIMHHWIIFVFIDAWLLLSVAIAPSLLSECSCLPAWVPECWHRGAVAVIFQAMTGRFDLCGVILGVCHPAYYWNRFISAVTHSFFACSVLGLVGIMAWLEVIITVLVKYVIAWISTWGSYGARARDTAVTTVDTGISRSKAGGIISGIAFAFPTPWSMTIISNLILCYWSDLPFFSLSFLDRDINNCLFVCFERKQLVELAKSSQAVIFLCLKKDLQF